MAGAHGFDLPDLLHDGFWRGGIVPLGAGPGAGCQDAAVEPAADHEGRAAPLAQRQEFVQRVLLEQRVASCHQQRIEVPGLHEVQHDLPVVDADADRLHEALFAQFDEGAVAAVHGLPEIDLLHLRAMGEHVGVVDEQDVDVSKPQPLQRILEAPHGPVIRIVEAAPEGCAVDPGLEVDILAPRRRQHAAHLAGDHEFMARFPAQVMAETEFRQPMAVIGRGVEVAHARLPGALHHRTGLRLRNGPQKIADGRCAEAHVGDVEAHAAELADVDGVHVGSPGMCRFQSGRFSQRMMWLATAQTVPAWLRRLTSATVRMRSTSALTMV